MSKEVNNTEYRYEMLGLGMGESAFYWSPSVGYREYLYHVCGVYQASPEEPLISLSKNGKLYDLLVVFANHKLAKAQVSINHAQTGALTVIDPHRKANSFSGKLLIMGQLQNKTILIWFIDATGTTPKSISVYLDRYDLPEAKDLLMFFMRRFSKLNADDVERMIQDNQDLFLPIASDSLAQQDG